MNRQQSKKRQRGSALVETGFIFTTFAFMLIGAFDFGQFLFIHQALVERARTAARWGAVSDPTNHTAIQNMVLYNESTAPVSQGGGGNGWGGGLNTTAPGYFGLTSDMVQVSDPGSGTNDYRLTVFITNYPYTVLSPYIGGTHIGPNITVSYPIGQ
jgi:Flp pilus assembly protein TadG